MDNPLILDNGKDIVFYCAKLEGKTTLTAFANGTAAAITQVQPTMNWHFMKKPSKQVMGLKNLSKKPTAKTMPNL